MNSRSVLIVTVFTAVNLFVSLLNQVVLAYLFGASGHMDAFLMAGALPLTMLALAIGELGYVLIPLLMQYKNQPEELTDVLQRLFSFIAVAAVVIAGVGLLGHTWLLRWTTAATTPQVTFELAVSLAPLIWLIVGLDFISSFLTGALHFYRRFGLPVVVVALPYLGMMGGGLVGASRLGIKSVVLGWLVGALLRVLVLGWGFRRQGRLQFRWGLRHPSIPALCASLVPLGVSLLPFTLLPVIDVFWASTLPTGSLSYLGYSNRIVIATTAIVVQGVSVVLFPTLSEDQANGRLQEFHTKVSSAIKTILLVIIPIAVVETVLRAPLLGVLFERGNFDRAAKLAVAQVLPWYLLGMIWMAPMNIVSRAFYALRNYATPAKLAVLSLSLYMVLCGILSPYFSYVGIGMAYVIYWAFTFLLQYHVLARRTGAVFQRDLVSFLAKVMTSAALAGLLVAFLTRSVDIWLGQVAGMMFSGLSGLVMFSLLGYFVFRIPHFRTLVAGFLRK
ncbi:MAG: hypothetical protein HY653_02805 [Acidobacteria bacterium]|nr:hypothetical protein [Acidobacteriota bacterium]